MTKVEATEAQAHFSELIDRVEADNERIVIEQAGQAKVVLISYADLKRLEALEEDLRDVEAMKQAMAEAEEEGFVSLEEVIKGYNELHGTNFTLENLTDD